MDEKIKDLLNWREQLGVAPSRLAGLARISPAALRAIETGKSKPQAATIGRLIKALRDIEAGVIPRRGSPPKPETFLTETAASETKESGVVPIATIAAPATKVELPATTGPLLLSNIDLELINRVLNMDGPRKIALLEKLIKADH